MLALIAAAFAACQPSEGVPPVRPVAVPAEAVWAGGPDGGAWIRCVPLAGTPDGYDCATYDQAGRPWAEGTFVLRRVRWDRAAGRAAYAPARRPDALRYSAFDGETIHLLDSLVLIRSAP